MFATLNLGTANRALAVADLNVPDTGTGACGLHAAPVPSVRADFFEVGLSSGASTTICGYQDQGNSVSIKQAALSAVLADWPSTAGNAAEMGHILDDGASKSPWNQIGLRTINLQDEFWSDIDGEPVR